MASENSKWHFLKLDLKKVVVILLLFGAPHILRLFGLTIASQYVLTDYLIYPVIIIIVMVFGIPFASPTNLPGWYQALAGIVALVAAPVIIYILICMMIAAWDDIFDRLCGRRSKLCQGAVLAVLLIPFVYSAIYVPSLTASRFRVEPDIPSEISISKDAKTFYDENGPFRKYILKEFIVRNDNDFQMTHEVPREIRGVCLYDTRTGIFDELGGYYAHEDGHGFVDPGTWNTLVLGPKSKAKYYLLGDMNLSDKFDEILLSKDGRSISGKYCHDLTKEDVDKNKGIEIIKIVK